jgi:hypothetical protein
MKRRCLGLALTSLLVLAAGCSSANTATPDVSLGAAKESIVEGLPIPSSAVFLVGKQNIFGEYRMPSGVSLASLNEWFDHHLPPNTSWGHWSWCHISHAHGFGVGSMAWTWKMDGSLLDLVTTSVGGRSRFTVAHQKLLLVCS